MAGVLALDKQEADFYTAIHAQTALTFAALVAMAMVESQADEAYA
jgi:hypothetical protein